MLNVWRERYVWNDLNISQNKHMKKCHMAAYKYVWFLCICVSVKISLN